MTLLVGIDDTDSRDGMCTTWLARRVREAFPEVPEARPSRLVRLNPNVPWKTRGNAAIALAFEDGGNLDLDEALHRARRVVERHARLGAPGTEPGIVVSRRPLPRRLYERAVREIVPHEAAVAAIEGAGARAVGLAGGRGVIGAAAALAWEPGDRTFEAIAYRDPARWGTPRVVVEDDVRALESRFPTTFDSYDALNREVVMVPASPCPVLFGVRGEDAAALPPALASVRGEPAAEWTLFETNQATDDHLRPFGCGEVPPLASAAVAAVVAERPRDVNGHVFLELVDATGRLRAAAYAPTEGFRGLVRRLRAGDRVVAVGGAKPGPDGRLTLGLEKVRVDVTASSRRKTANPACGRCGKSMKSAGRAAGYRCRACGTRAPPASGTFAEEPRGGVPGWHEVPARARRHLAKPLKRGPPPPSAVPGVS